MVPVTMNPGELMKIFISILVLITLTSCGKNMKEETGTSVKRSEKSAILSQQETWSILSDRRLPLKVKVVINELEFINECSGLGRSVIERHRYNGAIHISSFQAFRQEYFSIDIFDCEEESVFFTGDYIDQTMIEHPVSGAVSIILRLKN